ncbi:MAG: methyltransferase domain-containing protein [Oscillospiraceae bacterium]|nr:methyltransferase domain-containing protein [Oscillospiraceae bacterium]
MIKPINPDILHSERFPRSNKYDPMWIFENKMGPNPLWLTEFLVQSFDLKPGMRILDLVCGKGMTSVFLAREFGVQVFAVDFDQWGGWTTPEIRWKNAKEYGVEHLVVPITADARNLPFAQGFFDAVVCVDAYIYFGADDAYLNNIIKFMRPGGQLGMVVPGYIRDVTNGIPEYIKDFLGDELWTWQSFSWWKNLWKKNDLVSMDTADILPNGCDLWLRWDKTLIETGNNNDWPDETDIFETDKGEYIGFIRLVATKK